MVKVVLVNIPLIENEEFVGNIDLITGEEVRYSSDDQGVSLERSGISEQFQDTFELGREKLIESLSDYSDEIAEMYLEGEEISETKLIQELRKLTVSNQINPVLCGSAFKNKGVQLLLDAIVNLLPSPQDRGEVFGFDPKNNEKKIGRTPDEKSPFSALSI